MVKDAKMYADEDEKRKNVADAKANGEQIIVLFEKTMKEDKEKGVVGVVVVCAAKQQELRLRGVEET